MSDGVTFSLTWLDVAEWMMETYYLPEQIVCNAWMRKGYAWFSNDKEVEDINGGVHIGGDNVFLMMMPKLIQVLIQILIKILTQMLIQMLIQMCLMVRFEII